MIELSRALFEEIVAHARAGSPNEACGVVAGEDGRAVRVYPMRNAEASQDEYRFDDQEQMDVFNEVEKKGWDLLAFFHSHTHTEAYPSGTDMDLAYWPDPVTGERVLAHPGTAYLILSLKDADPVLRAFRFEDGEPLEEDVRIT